MPITDYDVIDAMLLYGGSFVIALGKAYRFADDINQAKLKAAFPEYWEQYRELAELQRQRNAAKA